MKPWSTVERIAVALERLVALGESWMGQQKLRVPPRAPSDEPLPKDAVSVYDPYLESAREQRAWEMWQRGDAKDLDDAYQKTLDEERQG